MENNKTTQEIEQMKRKSDGSNIYPKTITEAVFDKESGIQLNDMIKSFNCIYLPQIQIPNVQDNLFGTRCLIPHKFRRPMMFVTRLDLNNKLILEYFIGENIEDHTWGDSRYWQSLFEDGNGVIVKSIEKKGDTLTFEEQINQLWINKFDGTKDKAGQPLTYFKMVPNEGKNFFTLYGTKDPDSSSWNDAKWISDGYFLGEVTNLLKVWKYFNDMDSAMADINNIPDSGIIAVKNDENWDLYAKENNTYIRLGGLSVSVSEAIKTTDFERNLRNDDQPATCKAIVDYFNRIKSDKVLDPTAMTELMFSQSSSRLVSQMTTKGLISSVLQTLPDDRIFISNNNKKIGTHGSTSVFSNENGTGVVINQNSNVIVDENKKVYAGYTGKNSMASQIDTMNFSNGLMISLISLDTEYEINQEEDYFYSSLPFMIDMELPESIPDAVLDDTINNVLKYKIDIKDDNNNIIYSVFSYQIHSRDNQKVIIPQLFLGKSKLIYVCVNLLYTVKETYTINRPSLNYNVYPIGEESNLAKICCFYHKNGTEINPDYIQTPEIKTDKINGKDIESIGGFDLFKLQKELLIQQRMLNIPGFVSGTQEKLFTIENGIQIIPGVEYVLYKFTAKRTSTGGNSIDTDSIFDSCPIEDSGNNVSIVKNNLICRKKPEITSLGYIKLSIKDETFFPMVRTGVTLPNTRIFKNTSGDTFYNIFFEIKGVLGGAPICDEVKLKNDRLDYCCHEHTFTTNGGLTKNGDHVTITAKVIFTKIQP